MIAITHFKAVIAAMAFVAVFVVLAVMFVHVDLYPALHTYGLSVGTNNHYWSLDLVRGHLAFSMQSAR